jgi:hypothetical protein
MTGERSLQIEDLSVTLPNEHLWGAFRVKETEGTRLVLVGWTLGMDQEVKAVELLAGGNVVASTAPSLPRPDIVEHFPDRAAAADCGFELTVEAKGRGESVLDVRVVMEDGSQVGIGEIRAVAPARRWSDILRRH